MQVRKNDISLILLDIVMPVMTGYEFLEKMKQSGMDNMPVIVTTGSSDDKAEQKALDLGAWDFVTKPFNGKVFFSRLKNAIARSELPAYEKLQYVSEHDELTGMFNRKMMFSETRRMIDAHPGIGFVFIRFDIDRFALYNTSFGEKEGNRLLRYMADFIKDMLSLRPLYTCGRISADVFFICGQYDNNVDLICERIDATQKHLISFRKDYRLELSAGVCIMDDASLSIDEYYFRTTVAAQKCKNKINMPYAFYDTATGNMISREVSIANEMQKALDERQFIVYLQPKFALPSEKICGAEALVRWQHPTNGMVSPGAFIPVFEKNGFVAKLDYYVWEETCRMLSSWRSEGRRIFPVSVNISRINMYNPHLTEMVTELVERYSLPPHLLQLEITESAYMTNPELMEKTIAALHEAGFTILMDDFGSGYSSLNTLKRINVDVLKVDMKFLPVNDEAGRAEIILASVIKMAGLLGMRVIVEGVETDRQRDFLDGAGCDCIQGYYYSRPIPRLEYEQKYLSAEDAAPDALHGGAQDGQKPACMNSILLMTGNAADRAAIAECLGESYGVYTCDSIEAGLSYMRRNGENVRLMIADIEMPGMSGMDLLEYSRLDDALKGIPRMIIVDAGDMPAQEKAVRDGAYDCLTRPFSAAVVASRVCHAMARRNGCAVCNVCGKKA